MHGELEREPAEQPPATSEPPTADLATARTLQAEAVALIELLAVIVILSILVFNHGAGSVLEGFSFAMLGGIIIGTYSSIYVASTTLLELGVSKFDLLQVEKEGAAVDDRP